MVETHPEKRLIGYARVSTVGQTLDSQLEQLRATGCTSRNIYRERATGARPDRRRKHGRGAGASTEANAHTTEAQRAPEETSWEARPAREALAVTHLGPPADELGHVAGQMVEKGVAAAGLADGAARLVERAFDYFADFIAPPPPPTTDQVEQMQKAAEERRQQEPAAREEQEARLQEILEQIRRDDQRAREEEERALQPLDGVADRPRRRLQQRPRARPVAVSCRIEAVRRRHSSRSLTRQAYGAGRGKLLPGDSRRRR